MASGPLSLVLLDHIRGPDLGFFRILSELAERAALAEEIPALVGLDADRLESHAIGLGAPAVRTDGTSRFHGPGIRAVGRDDEEQAKAAARVPGSMWLWPNVAVDRPAANAGRVVLDAGGDFAGRLIAHAGRWPGGDTFGCRPPGSGAVPQIFEPFACDRPLTVIEQIIPSRLQNESLD